ncbi:MAG: pyruvate formate lyase-activating protein [Clostridia bacterium]|nr:pyruvate formate lyase-activating protein [Clostridia bacterium]
MSLKGNIHSIESFGTVDGPGIRFVVFFRGCPMRCLYCHNPDTWSCEFAKEYTAEELVDRVVRNEPFYRTGGITASGGEPMLQLDFLTELFELAKRRDIHTCLDTSGILFDPNDEGRVAKIDRMLKSADLVMLDIKHIDDEEHKALTSRSNKNVLAFAEHLRELGVNMRVRYVLVPGITDKREHLLSLGKYLSRFDNLEKIEVLPYHTLGKVKYQNLGIDYPLGDTPDATASDAAAALEIIKSAM